MRRVDGGGVERHRGSGATRGVINEIVGRCALSPPKWSRALYQSAQAVPRARHRLREARRQRSGDGRHRLHRHLVRSVIRHTDPKRAPRGRWLPAYLRAVRMIHSAVLQRGGHLTSRLRWPHLRVQRLPVEVVPVLRELAVLDAENVNKLDLHLVAGGRKVPRFAQVRAAEGLAGND